jgi:hypothetical protein
LILAPLFTSIAAKPKHKRLNIIFTTILLVLGCFSLSPVVKAIACAPGIVGLWHEYYTSNFGPTFETYSQWHSDGLEIESPIFHWVNARGLGNTRKAGPSS